MYSNVIPRKDELYFALEVAGFVATGYVWVYRIHHLCFLIEKEILNKRVFKDGWIVYRWGPWNKRLYDLILCDRDYFEFSYGCEKSVRMTNDAYRLLIELREEFGDMYDRIRYGLSRFGVMSFREIIEYIEKNYPEWYPETIELI